MLSAPPARGSSLLPDRAPWSRVSKLMVWALAVAGCLLATGNTLAGPISGFQDIYAPGNWTQSPGTGSINTLGAPASISLTSGNDLSGDPSDTDFTIVMTHAGTISFDWNYLTTDLDGPFYDPFGYLVNGIFTQLTVGTEVGGPSAQSGQGVLVNLSIGDTFGFRQRTDSNLFGSATTTISNFSGPGPSSSSQAVPVPATALILPVGFGLLALARRRQTKASA